MYRLKCVALCFIGYYAMGAATPVSFIKPCKPEDFACLKANVIAATPHFVAGIPELGLPPADPIVLNDIRADDKDFKLGFRNMKVTGISKCKVLEATRDLEKSTITLVEECPISATGQYDLNGKVLFVPAEGDGDFIIKTDKVKIEVTMKIKVLDKDGAKHWKITGFDYNYDIIDKPTIVLDNLYCGDETRAKPIREVLANSATELINELGKPIIKQLLSKEAEIINDFFKAISLSDLVAS